MSKTIEWSNGNVKILDQTLLPAKSKVVVCKTYKDTAEAIKKMKIRGAPALGVAAGFGLAQVASASKARSFETFAREIKRASDVLRATRPTAVNLGWALDRVDSLVDRKRDLKIDKLKQVVVKEALDIQKEDVIMNQSMARHGAELLRSGDRVLTHCNTGSLETAGMGTALGVIQQAHLDKKKISVWVDETRPYLQGARLTAWELQQAKIPHTLITDSTAAALMGRGEVDIVIVGADRITAQGDVANKIGTYGLAILACEHQIPFYVVAPRTTVDMAIQSGDDIPIEERSSLEVTQILGKDIAPKGTKALHLGFDVTPHRYISAIVTEKGVLRAPFGDNLADHMKIEK
jgi:methylthioribose-1-phosphate isomerase